MSDLLSFEDCLAVLTSKEGDSVTVLAQNPDANHVNEQFAIDVTGEWTDWKGARYLGDTQLSALKAAAIIKRILER